MTQLYDLSPEFAAVADVDEWEGATFQERADALATIDFDVRCDQLLRAHRNLESQKAALTAEMDRLRAKLNAVENRREEVRTYLRSVMCLAGTRKFKSTIATASLSAGREKIVLDEDENMRDHVKRWPFEIVAKAVTYPPPKVSKTVLQREFGDQLIGLPGVSVEVGDDILTIK